MWRTYSADEQAAARAGQLAALPPVVVGELPTSAGRFYLLRCDRRGWLLSGVGVRSLFGGGDSFAPDVPVAGADDADAVRQAVALLAGKFRAMADDIEREGRGGG